MEAERVESLESVEFKSGLEVVEYLKSKGFKVSKSKVYRDIQDGLLNKNNSGVFTERAVLTYAKRFCEPLDGGALRKKKTATVSDIKTLQAEMLALKKQMLERQIEIEAGNYIKKDEVTALLASRAARFKNDLMSMIYKEVPELCAIFEGDEKKISNAIAYLKQKIEDILREYAK